MRRLRVLSEHPRIGRPNDVVREFEHAQAYVDIGVCEWIDDELETTAVDAASVSGSTVVDRSQTVETTDRGAVETTSVRTTAKPAASRPGATTTPRRRAT